MSKKSELLDKSIDEVLIEFENLTEEEFQMLDIDTLKHLYFLIDNFIKKTDNGKTLGKN